MTDETEEMVAQLNEHVCSILSSCVLQEEGNDNGDGALRCLNLKIAWKRAFLKHLRDDVVSEVRQ